METIANVEPVVVCARAMQIFFGSFLYIYLQLSTILYNLLN